MESIPESVQNQNLINFYISRLREAAVERFSTRNTKAIFLQDIVDSVWVDSTAKMPPMRIIFSTDEELTTFIKDNLV